MSGTAIRTSAAIAAAALLLAGCAGEPGPRTTSGAAVGALAGGTIGALTGGRTGDIIGGAILGGIVGGVIGNALDEEDRRRAYAAELEALENARAGTPHRWQGRSGNYGVIQPGQAYSRGAYQQCRDYTHTIYINGRPEVGRGTACRNPDGTWTQIT
jgi:surface antigen